MRFEHEALGIWAETPERIPQRLVEGFFAARRKLDGDERMRISSPEFQGNMLRAARSSGFFSAASYGVGEVGDLEPRAVRWLAGQLDSFLAELLEIPPK